MNGLPGSNTSAACIAALLLLAVTGAASAAAPVCGYQVVASYPHDPWAFTEGLVMVNGVLYEGTGLWGSSSIRRVDLETGAVLQQSSLGNEYFGEGITIWGDHLIQLTYRSNLGFVYNRSSFALVDFFSYTGEGWGLTHDERRLIMSDGSSYLRFRDPVSYAQIGQVQVVDGSSPVSNLNELEVIGGEVFANVWQTDLIARINPRTGEVIAWIDCSGLLASEPAGAVPWQAWRQIPDVLNGIAYDIPNHRLLVTGKRWPLLFEIEMVGCPPVLLHSDGFESGDLSAWPFSTESSSFLRVLPFSQHTYPLRPG